MADLAAAPESLGATARRSVTQIMSTADALPWSNASGVLTAVVCRVSLVSYELTRARVVDPNNEIDGMLARLMRHAQLLAVASASGEGLTVQSGYAMLSELGDLLQDLEGAVLRVPAHLGNDARFKPALDELQALLAKVAQYRAEAEDTRSHLEAALSDLVHGCGSAPGLETASSEPAAATIARVDAPLGHSHSGSETSASSAPAAADGAGPQAVLERVRRVICSLGLDMDMTDRGQEQLDAELLSLRDHMQQALQEQHDVEQENQQQGKSQHGMEREREPAAAAAERKGNRRARDGPGGPEDPHAAALAGAGAGAAVILHTGFGPHGRVARLHAARHVSRALAAQHLARLKEQHRQQQEEAAAVAAAAVAAVAAAAVAAEAVTAEVVEAEGTNAAEQLPAARRRRTRSSADVHTQMQMQMAGGSSTARFRESASDAAAVVPEVHASSGALRSGSSTLGGASGSGVAAAVWNGEGADAVLRLSSRLKMDSEEEREEERRVEEEEEELPLTPVAGGRRPSSIAGRRSGVMERSLSMGVESLPDLDLEVDVAVGGGGGGGGGGQEAASVAALRKLNRVTRLAGMWEAGGPVAAAQEGEDAESGGGSGSDSDGEGPRGGRGGVGGELPCRPAEGAGGAAGHGPRRQLHLPDLPLLPGGGGGRLGFGGGGAAASSPFLLLAMQGRAPEAPPPPVLGRILCGPREAALGDEDVPASPAAAGGGRGGRGSGGGALSPTALTAPRQKGGAPAPLPLPDASVHLRAVGFPGWFSPAPAAGPFGPAYGLALAAEGGELDAAQHAHQQQQGGGAQPFLDFGPDVPTLDLHRDITGWGACLGRGAFGAVYKALFRNRPVAVKVLHGGALDARDLRALRSEISLLCRPGLRQSANIISVFGAASTPFGDVALVTELMDCDLYDYIHRRRQNCVPMDEVLSIARSIAAGLSELHPAIVHRDLKPANVLLRHSAAAAGAKEGGGGGRLVVKIADFGLARHKRSQYLSTRERNAGTLKYLAPECIASGGSSRGGGSSGLDGEGGSGITEKCDVYSFGVLLYELITGREPWEGCHPLYAICQVQSGVTLPVPDDPARCPPALRSLVLRCLAYQHHGRPSSSELVAELDRLIVEHGEQQRRQQGDSGAEVAAAPLPWQ